MRIDHIPARRLSKLNGLAMEIATEGIVRHLKACDRMDVNPETSAVREIIDDALSQMVAYMDAHPEVGILGPHTLNSDGSTQSSKRRFPTTALGFFESTWLQGYASKSMRDRFYATDVPDTIVADFAALHSALHNAHAAGGLSAAEVAVRKMSDKDAADHATSILDMYASLSELRERERLQAPRLRVVGERLADGDDDDDNDGVPAFLSRA